MITKTEKSWRVILQLPLDEARAGWISRVRLEKQQVKTVIEHYESVGFERVEAAGPLTSDGREVLIVEGVPMALRPEIHAERLVKAFDAARKRQAESPTTEPTSKESIAAATCPQMVGGKPCGGALNRKGVCPSCITGRMGYKYRYTCESCGFDIVTREELR
jgi:hypothetical protein